MPRNRLFNIQLLVGKGSILPAGGLLMVALLVVACQPQAIRPTPRLPLLPGATPTVVSTATPVAWPTVTPRPHPSATAANRPAPTAAPTKMTPAGHVTIGLVGRADTLNPLLSLNPALNLLGPMLYPSLLKTNPQTGAFQPGLADMPRIAADGLTVTYTLRAGNISPADVQAGIEATIRPELDDVRRVATDPAAGQVIVTLTQPNCALLDALAQLPVLPQTDVSADAPATTTGPFAIEDWDAKAGRLRLTANPEAATGLPRLKTIDIRFFPTEKAAIQALEAGELDILPLRQSLDPAPAGFTALSVPGTALTFIGFNNRDSVLRQAPVRQALTLALNRPRIEQFPAGQGQPATGFLPAGHWAAVAPAAAPEYNPTAAAAMLTEAGLFDRDGDGRRDTPDGQRWEVSIRADERRPIETTLAFEAAESYRQVGVYARAELVPFETLADDLLTHDYQVAVYTLPLPVTFDYRAWWHSDWVEADFGLNLTAYSRPAVDARLAEANRVPACAAPERKELYGQIQAQLATDAPADFVLFADTFLIVRRGLTGLQPGPFAPFTWNIAALAFDR